VHTSGIHVYNGEERSSPAQAVGAYLGGLVLAFNLELIRIEIEGANELISKVPRLKGKETNTLEGEGTCNERLTCVGPDILYN